MPPTSKSPEQIAAEAMLLVAPRKEFPMGTAPAAAAAMDKNGVVDPKLGPPMPKTEAPEAIDPIAQKALELAKVPALGPKLRGTVENYNITHTGERKQGPVDNPVAYAPMSFLAALSLPKDEKTKLDMAAKWAEPDLYSSNPDLAKTHVGMKEGRLYYLPKGKSQAFWMQPAPFSSLRGAWRVFEPGLDPDKANSQGAFKDLAQMPKDMAGQFGPGLSNVPGVVAGTITTPLGMQTSISAAALSNAIGDGFRQSLMFLHDPTEANAPKKGQMVDAGFRGAWEQGAGLAAGKVVNFLGKSLLEQMPRFDAAYADKLAMKAEAVSDPNNKLKMFPAELSQDPHVAALTRGVMGRTTNLPIIEKAFSERNSQFSDSVKYLAEKIAPGLEDPMAGAAMAKSGAEAVIRAKQKALQEVSRPLYALMEKKSADMSAFKGRLDDLTRPGNQTISESAKTWLKNNIYPELGEPSYAFTGPGQIDATPRWVITGKRLDDIKKKLDTAINFKADPSSGFDASVKNSLRDLRGSEASKAGDGTLLGEGDAQIPEWKAARSIFETELPTLEKARNSRFGRLKDWEESDGAMKAINDVFNPRNSSPQAVGYTRDQFIKAGQEPQWNALVRTYIEHNLNQMKADGGGKVYNLGANFRNSIFGNDAQQAILKEAMKNQPDLQRSMEWLMDVADAMKRVPNQSFEALASQANEEFSRQAQRDPKAWFPFVGPEFYDTLAVWNIPKKISQFIRQDFNDKFGQRMANILFDPTKLSELRQLYDLSPRSAAGIVGFSHLMLQDMTGPGHIFTPTPEERANAQAMKYHPGGKSAIIPIQK